MRKCGKSEVEKSNLGHKAFCRRSVERSVHKAACCEDHVTIRRLSPLNVAYVLNNLLRMESMEEFL